MGLTLKAKESHFSEIAAFKDVNNKWRTKSLFIELTEAGDKYPAFFTLAEDDREVDGTVTWNAIYKFPGGTDPTITAAANSVDLVTMQYDATDAVWYCVASQNFS